MIIFGYKNGEHLSFSGVYYIRKLKMNILSMGQLDAIGYVKDAENHLITKIQCTVNRLFVLGVDITQPGCLLPHAEEEAWQWHAQVGHFGVFEEDGKPSLG
jgi:hypothetical protein